MSIRPDCVSVGCATDVVWITALLGNSTGCCAMCQIENTALRMKMRYATSSNRLRSFSSERIEQRVGRFEAFDGKSILIHILGWVDDEPLRKARAIERRSEF